MLENPKINIKLKLSALWTSILFLYIYADYFELYTPEKVKNLFNNAEKLDSPNALLMAAIVIAIPILMIVLSIFLKPKINRLLNISIGILFTLLVIVTAMDTFSKWYSFYLLYCILEAILTIIIVWTAWKWPKV